MNNVREHRKEGSFAFEMGRGETHIYQTNDGDEVRFVELGHGYGVIEYWKKESDKT